MLQVMNPTGDGKIDDATLKRKVRTLQVHVKLPMLVAGFILINGLAAVCLPPLDRAHPSWRAPLTAHRRAMADLLSATPTLDRHSVLPRGLPHPELCSESLDQREPP